jgi:hypothetical protein
LVHCEFEVLFGFVAFKSVLGCEEKIISEVLVSGFEGEKKPQGFVLLGLWRKGGKLCD